MAGPEIPKKKGVLGEHRAFPNKRDPPRSGSNFLVCIKPWEDQVGSVKNFQDEILRQALWWGTNV